MALIIPVALFAYARPNHLRRTLACLRENNVPLIYAFSDGPRTPEMTGRVKEVREILREINWCEVHLIERSENLGLGKSILTGVSEVFRKHEAIIVFEDDLICVPGTYEYLGAALEHYKDEPRVMSVTGWTHPLVTPSTITDQPYFDGRTESWSWGTWARVWKGMEQDAMSLVNSCIENKIDVYRYGADLLEMAKAEKERNIWAVRFSYLHILHGGLCLRPPHSMVNHAGFDEQGTNANGPSDLSLEVLEASPIIPHEWPPAIENPECTNLWLKEYGGRPINNSRISKVFQLSAWIKLFRYFGKRMTSGISRVIQPLIDKLTYLGGISEYIAVRWLLRIYQSKFRLDWEFSKIPPHFYNHRIGMSQLTFGKKVYGPYTYYRGFFASQVIQEGDTLLDIGCGDGFFTKRFFSLKCSRVDGVDIEPSAIQFAMKDNCAENIKYHLLDAVAKDFPEREYNVIVWDGAIGHFSPDTLETMLQKIRAALSQDGIFCGSESLGVEGADHLTRFDSLDDFGKLFSKYFRFVEVYSKDYKLNNESIRHEAYWRCANQPDRLQRLTWNKYYTE